jgi:putative PEP-CTERM system TPR-repeat lipoprotein
LVLALVAPLGGCSKDSPESLLRSAQEYAAKGDHSAAIIQLKNALQLAPNNGEARRLLGEQLLSARDPVSAERELRRAIELKQPVGKVAAALAQALFETRQYDKLVSEFGEFNAAALDQAKIRTFVGEAQIAQGRPQEAAVALAAALQAVAGFPPAVVGQARLAAVGGNGEQALELVNQALASAPKLGDAYLLKSQILLTRGDRGAAKQTLEQALQADPTALAAHLGLVLLHLDDNAVDEAATQLEAARKHARGDLRLQYFDAVIAYRRNDLGKARDLVQQVLKRAELHVPSRVLAGAVELQAGRLIAAEDHLRRALAGAPTHAGARRLLVATLLRMGQPTRAVEALPPLLEAGASDPAVLLLAGETYLAKGDAKQAAEYFKAASSSPIQGHAAKTRLGQIALARGDEEAGFRELEAVAQESGGYQADLALVAEYTRRGAHGKALASARALVQKQPKNPLAFQVLGNVQILLKDFNAARASMEQALQLAPTYLSAAYALAALDIADKRPEAARARFESMLEKDPKNEQIVLAQAEFEARQGATPAQLAPLLQKAVSLNPQSANARVALIRFHLGQRNAGAALAAAREAVAVAPSDARLVEVLAMAQEANGEINQAIDSVNKLISLRPDSSAPLIRLAALQARRKEYERAADALLRAQKVAPGEAQIDLELAAVYLAAGKLDAALKTARGLSARNPKRAGGYLLEGDVLAAQGKYGEAERAFRDALRAEPAAPAAQVAAAKLVGTLYAGRKAKEAEAFASKWITDHPRDAAVRMYLGDRAMRESNQRAAQAYYQAVVTLFPNHVLALNNLAYVGGDLGDPKAIEYAERAAKLAPNSAAVLDTLGVLLVNKGDAKRGLEYLGKARKLAPDRADIQLNHARALVKAGEKEQARKVLEELAATPGETREKSAASALLKSL